MQKTKMAENDIAREALNRIKAEHGEGEANGRCYVVIVVDEATGRLSSSSHGPSEIVASSIAAVLDQFLSDNGLVIGSLPGTPAGQNPAGN